MVVIRVSVHLKNSLRNPFQSKMYCARHLSHLRQKRPPKRSNSIFSISVHQSRPLHRFSKSKQAKTGVISYASRPSLKHVTKSVEDAQAKIMTAISGKAYTNMGHELQAVINGTHETSDHSRALDSIEWMLNDPSIYQLSMDQFTILNC